MLSFSAKLCIGAFLTSAAFMLQLSCVLFPVLGVCLGAACTPVVAAAGFILKRRALLVYIGAGVLLLMISPRYALEFLLTTGFVGLTLGLLPDRNPVLPLLVSGLGMFAGLCGLIYLFGTAAFGGLPAGVPFTACLPVFAVFSAAYPAIRLVILKRVLKKRVQKFCFSLNAFIRH